MNVTRIDLEGKDGRYATITRRKGTMLSDWIEVTILTPQEPNGRKHQVAADCDEDIRSMAECLQYHLDGYRGTGSDIYGYVCELERFQY